MHSNHQKDVPPAPKERTSSLQTVALTDPSNAYKEKASFTQNFGVNSSAAGSEEIAHEKPNANQDQVPDQENQTQQECPVDQNPNQKIRASSKVTIEPTSEPRIPSSPLNLSSEDQEQTMPDLDSEKSPNKDNIMLSNLNISPRGLGDCTIEDI